MINPLRDLLDHQSMRISRWVGITADRTRLIPGVRLVELTFRGYSEDRGSVLAAALSYYAFLSLFPLTLFILALLSPFLETTAAIRAVTRFLESYLPQGADTIRTSLEEVIHLRGPITLAAAAGFLWSGSGVFSLIQLGMNRAFCVAQPRPLWRERVVSLGMVIAVGFLFALSFLLTTSFRLGIHYQILPRHNIIIDWLPPLLSEGLGVAIFGLLYRYIPYTSYVRWRQIWPAALVASTLWELAKMGFAWYIANLALLNLVYGSLGTIIALLIWGYVTAVILLLGAELAAALAGAREHPNPDKPWSIPRQDATRGPMSNWGDDAISRN